MVMEGQNPCLVSPIKASGGQPANETAIRTITPAAVAKEDQARFVELALEEFKTLHAGNVIRFGLRPLEFAVWEEQREHS